MANGFALVVQIIAVVLCVVATLIWVYAWRSGLNRKWAYLFLTFGALTSGFMLQHLFVLVGAPRAWQNGVVAVSLALVAVALVLLYRHRHDPDPDEV